MENICNEIKNAGFYMRDGYVYFGEYPQTVKANNVTVSNDSNDRGYFLGSDGSNYAKITVAPYSEGYKFSSGDVIIAGNDYYFKIEPIRWRVLGESGGKVLLLSDSIIASKRFDGKSNIYAESELRDWLNGEFFATAFSTEEQEKVAAVTLDDIIDYRNSHVDKKTCKDIQDRVFPLSFGELVERTVKGIESRTIKTSDFDKDELDSARKSLRTDKESEARKKIQEEHGSYDDNDFTDSKEYIDKRIGEYDEPPQKEAEAKPVYEAPPQEKQERKAPSKSAKERDGGER